MLKKVFIAPLTLLFLPIAAALCLAFGGLMVAMIVVFLPLGALGLAFYAASEISEWILDYFELTPTLNSSKLVLLAPIPLQFVLAIVAYAPSAVVFALVTAVIAPLATLILIPLSAYYMSTYVVAKVGELSKACFRKEPIQLEMQNWENIESSESSRDLEYEEEAESEEEFDVINKTFASLRENFRDTMKNATSAYTTGHPFFSSSSQESDESSNDEEEDLGTSSNNTCQT